MILCYTIIIFPGLSFSPGMMETFLRTKFMYQDAKERTLRRRGCGTD